MFNDFVTYNKQLFTSIEVILMATMVKLKQQK